MKTVVFRPTNNCNLACTYCYDKNNHNKITSELRKEATDIFEKNQEFLLESFEILFEKEENPRVIYHGGEPLLIDSKVLDNFCHKLRNIKNTNFSIQTNGTLINNETIDLFKKYNFQVGISLDGCNESQNCARVFPNGINSFNVVYRNINKLRDASVKHGIIMSIGKSHLNQEQDIYDFIGDNCFSCNIRPIFSVDSSSEKSVMTPEEYAIFFNKLFDIWFYDDKKKVGTHQILELYQALKKELDPNYYDHSCSNSNQCFKDFICMDVFGELYACNRLYGIEDFHYGNLKNNTYNEIMQMASNLLMERNLSIEDRCGSCKMINKCYGGCPAESYDTYHDILHPSDDCKTKKLVSNHVREKMK